MWDYRAQLERIVDGDTVRLVIDHGMYLRSSQSIRLLDVWAPEMNTGEGKAARQFVINWMTEHQCTALAWPWHVVTEQDHQTFNRYIGEITCNACGESLNAAVRSYLKGQA